MPAEMMKYSPTMSQSLSSSVIADLEECGHHQIRDSCADRRPAGVVSGRVHPITQQNDCQVVLGVDPERGAGKAGVAETGRREQSARAAALRRSIPPQGSAGAGDEVLPSGEVPKDGPSDGRTV